MRIDISERITDEYARETINVSVQYRNLVNKPDGKLKDHFRQFTILLIVSAVMLLVLIGECLIWDFDAFSALLIGVLTIEMVICTAFRYNLTRAFESMKSKDGNRTLFLDESGVEISRDSDKSVRLEWENISSVRKFTETICFISNDFSGFVIAVPSRYSDQILDYIRDSGINVRIIQ